MSNDFRRPRVLVCAQLATQAIELLHAHAEVDIHLNISESELGQKIPNFEALIVLGQTKVTRDIIERGNRLRVIARAGASLANIDVAAARLHDIELIYVPGAYAVAVAEHTLGLMLALARRLSHADANVKGGDWSRQQLTGVGLAGKTVGVVGFGRIGYEVAIRAEAFGMNVIANQARPTPELSMAAAIENVDLEELLQRSDFVTIHVPLRDDTIGLLNAERLALLKKSAYLINTVRGGVLDEAALLAALDQEMIAGAALDVFEDDPQVTTALARHPRVIATPRIAARTTDAFVEASTSTAKQVIEILQQVEVENVLPLRVVAMDRIFPHESIDQKRVDRLANRLVHEKVLSNPPIVTEVEGGMYMVLDGATRTAALKQLNYPHAIVQIASPESGLGLHTWYHVIQGIGEQQLLNILRDLPDISLVEVEAERAADDMFAYGALCYISVIHGPTYLIQPTIGTNRLDALNQLTETYIEAAMVERTLENDIGQLRYEYPEMTALVVFPEYSVSQVMQVTLSGRYFPAGITRFVIPGRILRLNADLDVLRSDKSLREKNRWLNQLLEEKVRDNAIRYYREPVYLLDE